ncbi:MAG: cell cycle transcriptional regulator TrcR [Alphaproteobacteria bacterium]
MTAPLMPKATAVWLVENTTLTFKQIGDFCELHELEVQAIADGDVAFNIVGLNPVTGGQLTADEIARCEQDPSASLVGVEPERNVKAENSKNKKVLSPSQRSDKPAAILWILRNCPEIIDSQICKLIGTTKPTIASLRDGTHRDMANLRPKNPVAVGLCKEKDLDEAIAVSKKWTELKSQPKKTVKKKAGKSAAKAKAAAARKKEAEKLKAAAAKEKEAAKKKAEAAKKKEAEKKKAAAAKEKEAAKKKAAAAKKKEADRKKAEAARQKAAEKKAAAKEKAAAKKAAAKEKKAAAKKKVKKKSKKAEA